MKRAAVLMMALWIAGAAHIVESSRYPAAAGIASTGEVFFVISDQPVDFHEFAVFFRDALNCKNALFFDGNVSSLHAPELKRSDTQSDLGPLIGVVSGR